MIAFEVTQDDLTRQSVDAIVNAVWRGGRSGEPALLASCYTSALWLAEENELVSIAFPATSLELVRFVCFDARTAKVYRTLLRSAPMQPSFKDK